MCLDLILGCILTFSEGSVKPLIQEAFVPSALELSALCFWSLMQNTDEALPVDAPGCAVCHWGCGLGPTEAVSLPPPHSLWKLLSARNPRPGSAGDGDRKRQRHRRERGTPSGYFTRFPHLPCTLALISLEGLSGCNISFGEIQILPKV